MKAGLTHVRRAEFRKLGRLDDASNAGQETHAHGDGGAKLFGFLHPEAEK
jgi:hypothetical protein